MNTIHLNVDPENDFCPGGSLAVAHGDEVMQPLNDVARSTRANGGIVVHTKDSHPPITNHFIEFGGIWPPHCVVGTEGEKFHPSLDVQESDIIIAKGTKVDEDAFSGFQGATEKGETLAEIIKKLPRGKIIFTIGGLATDYCVKATVLDALALAEEIKDTHETEVILILDGIKAVNMQPHDGEKAIAEMYKAGAKLMTSEEAIAYIREQIDAVAVPTGQVTVA